MRWSLDPHGAYIQQMNKYIFDFLWWKKQAKGTENNKVHCFTKGSQGGFLYRGDICTWLIPGSAISQVQRLMCGVFNDQQEASGGESCRKWD